MRPITFTLPRTLRTYCSGCYIHASLSLHLNIRMPYSHFNELPSRPDVFIDRTFNYVRGNGEPTRVSVRAMRFGCDTLVGRNVVPSRSLISSLKHPNASTSSYHRLTCMIFYRNLSSLHTAHTAAQGNTR